MAHRGRQVRRPVLALPSRHATPRPGLRVGSRLLARGTMATNLYVGNLSPDTTSDDLRVVFGSFGAVVRAQVTTDRAGRSHGFGFVDMSNGAAKAIKALNGTPLHGRKL